MTTDPDVFVSAPDLRPSLRGIIRSLDEAGRLAGVATTIAIESGGWGMSVARRLAGRDVESQLANRVVGRELRSKTRTIWVREAARLVAGRVAGPAVQHGVWLWAELGFDRTVARRYAGRYPYLYGMEHSALATFTAQKAAGGTCVLRQVTAHGATIAKAMARAAARHPEFVDRYYATLLREAERLNARKLAECRLADLIIGNSAYVRQSFIEEGTDPQKVAYVPTGCPPVTENAARAGRENGRLRFLFVGTLSLRKGILELLAAWQSLRVADRAELWIAGSAELPPDRIFRNVSGVRYWGNVDRERVKTLMTDADVFVLPTLAEGLSHALLEALSAGLPVVTTPASGCGSLVRHEDNGLLLDDEEPAGIAAAMEWCLAHRDALPALGRRSRERAAGWTVEDSNRAHLGIFERMLDRTLPVGAAGGALA